MTNSGHNYKDPFSTSRSCLTRRSKTESSRATVPAEEVTVPISIHNRRKWKAAPWKKVVSFVQVKDNEIVFVIVLKCFFVEAVIIGSHRLILVRHLYNKRFCTTRDQYTCKLNVRLSDYSEKWEINKPGTEWISRHKQIRLCFTPETQSPFCMSLRIINWPALLT